MKKKESPSKAEKIISSYVVSGVPASSISNMCKELNINEKGLEEYLYGQTMGLIGDEAIVYECDILRFVRNQPVID